ncbi:thioesterase family protein [Nocardioides sp. KR10-350]|uniref:acyl-CoA thioesterase n=1 Tax=Nocardioides cheoyonin TaxID=3156615 RepID=UPI0032B61165
MRHTYECPMRWADLDLLGHVNNVVYVDYLQEARVDMLQVHARTHATDALAEATLVVSHQVTYVKPLLFDFAPVHIDCWVTEIRAAAFTLAYEVYKLDAAGERVVHLTATTVLAPYVFATESPRRLTPAEKESLAVYLEAQPTPKVEYGEPRHTDLGHYPVNVRFSDVDIYRHVNNVKYFEYFQEARIASLGRVEQEMGGRRPSMVVAQTDVEYRKPLLFRPEPYDIYTWLSHLGNRSMVLEAEILDAGERLARGRFVLVFFDPETERSIAPSDDVRAAFEKLA